jgi:hypothetical protein
MKEVYLVTKGKYSDYSVHGVFIDKAIAEEYAAQISDMMGAPHTYHLVPFMTASDLTGTIWF